MSPPRRDTHGVLVRLHKLTLDAIDSDIAVDPESPSRPEVIRRIIKAYYADRGHDLREWID